MKFRYALGVVLATGTAGLFLSACNDDPVPTFVPEVAVTTTAPTFSSAPSPTPSAPRRTVASRPAPHRTSAPATHRATVRPTPRRTTQAPASGVIMCRDGSVSHAQHRQGACSHHGGIA